ncbi:MAG TPA: signal peptidase II [Bacteroidota bacterium]|nr:signal peptidase II [Bacteroidota bacterium]
MRVLYLTGIVVLLDQAAKLFIKGFEIPILNLYHLGIPLGASYPIIGDFLRLTFIENPGMAFGIDVGGKLFLTIFSIVASVGIFFYLYKIRQEALVIRIALALILGGAIGNLIDRVFYGVIFGEGALFYGKVVDFIDVDFFNIDVLGFHLTRFPVFNLADSSVSIGVIMLLVFHKRFTETEEAVQPLAEGPLSQDVPSGVPAPAANPLPDTSDRIDGSHNSPS